MMKRLYACAVLFLLALNVNAAPISNSTSPVGFWKTIDDVTGQPKSIVQIEVLPNQTLMGKVATLYKDPARLCVACSGAAHNVPIVGLVIMSQLKQSQDNKSEWVGGQILDPKNGKVYHCAMHLVDNGQKLQVRGYIGLPLFGRTQTWERSESPTK
jgi:uncharacterized protein (DUF2147 family)